jgi:RHS repeat-associated protein
VNRSIPQVLDDEAFQGACPEPGRRVYGLGSTLALTDAAGEIVNSYDYDVFGALRAETGAQANDFTFAGEQVDGSTGLQYLRARYYDVEVGRFVSRDPLAASPYWMQHDFAYASSTPTLSTDPMGLASEGGGALAGWASPPLYGRARFGDAFPPVSADSCESNEGRRPEPELAPTVGPEGTPTPGTATTPTSFVCLRMESRRGTTGTCPAEQLLGLPCADFIDPRLNECLTTVAQEVVSAFTFRGIRNIPKWFRWGAASDAGYEIVSACEALY